MRDLPGLETKGSPERRCRNAVASFEMEMTNRLGLKRELLPVTTQTLK